MPSGWVRARFLGRRPEAIFPDLREEVQRLCHVKGWCNSKLRSRGLEIILNRQLDIVANLYGRFYLTDRDGKVVNPDICPLRAAAWIKQQRLK